MSVVSAWGRRPLALVAGCHCHWLPVVAVCVEMAGAEGAARLVAGRVHGKAAGRREEQGDDARSVDRPSIDSIRVVWVAAAGGGCRSRLIFIYPFDILTHVTPPTSYQQQPAKKKARRLARKAKAAAIAPRPTQKLRPVVHAPTQRVRILCVCFGLGCVTLFVLCAFVRCRLKRGAGITHPAHPRVPSPRPHPPCVSPTRPHDD